MKELASSKRFVTPGVKQSQSVDFSDLSENDHFITCYYEVRSLKKGLKTTNHWMCCSALSSTTLIRKPCPVGLITADNRIIPPLWSFQLIENKRVETPLPPPWGIIQVGCTAASSQWHICFPALMLSELQRRSGLSPRVGWAQTTGGAWAGDKRWESLNISKCSKQKCNKTK